MVCTRDAVIEAVSTQLAQFPGIELCMLYGSGNLARLTVQSDVDLAVVSTGGLTKAKYILKMLEYTEDILPYQTMGLRKQMDSFIHG